MKVYEVDVSGDPVAVMDRSGRVVAEAMGLVISGARVELVEPGLLAVRSSRLAVEKRNNNVYLSGTGSAGSSGGWF